MLVRSDKKEGIQMRLPKKIDIIEVGPRDGFQNVSDFIQTEDKIRIIELLMQSGIKATEVTSFVHPKAIPQMKDAKEVAEEVIKRFPGVRAIVLIPNEKGAMNAWACKMREVSYVISASEAHNLANVNRTIKESLHELQRIKESMPELLIRLDIATAFGCPYNGTVSEEQVSRLIDEAAVLGIREIILCDTIGIANPLQVSRLSQRVKERYPSILFTMHMHNTRGLGLANILSSMEQGMTSFETSIGGLGGCPFAPGAAGNVATEDLVNMLDYMDIQTGVSQEKLLEASAYVRDTVHAKLTGYMLNACKYEHI